MEREERVFLAYRAVFEGNNALIRQQKPIQKLVQKHRASAKTLLKSLGEQQIIGTLKVLLERKVFQSELEAKLAFPKLFTISSSQNVQHIASEADAARSEAEALEDVASVGGNDDDAQDNVVVEASSTLATAGARTQTIANVVRKPSLYPIYIPFKTQHLILNRAQVLLEECCYNFTTQWLPGLLDQRQWDCPEAIELNKWVQIVVKRLSKLPSQAFAKDSDLSLAGTLTAIIKLRHSAVHRLPTTAKGISEMIRSATRFASCLRDSAREQQFEELEHQLEGKIRALELNKNFLETKLDKELQEIARQRRELDEKEKEAVTTMLREDKEHGSLISGLLSRSVEHIFGEPEKQETDVTEAEPSSEYETEAKEEREHGRNADSGHRAEHDLSNREQSASDHIAGPEMHDSKPDHQQLATIHLLADGSAESQERLESGHDGLHSENRWPCTLDSPQITDLESELAGLSPETKDKITELGLLAKQQGSIVQDSCDNSRAQEAQNLLAGIPPQDVYAAYAKAVDAKLGTYDFRTGSYHQLSDKRLQRICQFAKKQTNLDTALHQIELENLIRARFTTFESEKRPPTNHTPKKRKKSKQSITQSDVVISKALDSQPLSLQSTSIDSQPIPKELSSRSPSSFKEILLPALSLPLDGPPSPSPPSDEDPNVSEPKLYRLAAVQDSLAPGQVGLLWIDDHGRVEGKLIVDDVALS